MSWITPTGLHDSASVLGMQPFPEQTSVIITKETHLQAWAEAQTIPIRFLPGSSGYDQRLAHHWEDTPADVFQFSWAGWLIVGYPHILGISLDQLLGVDDMIPGYTWGNPHEEVFVKQLNHLVGWWADILQVTGKHAPYTLQRRVEAEIEALIRRCPELHLVYHGATGG